MLHNPSLNERSECRLGLVMAARLTDAVPRRGTMREARNDEVHSCNTLYNRTCIRTRSPCTVLLRIKDAFSLRGWLSVYSDAAPIPPSAFASLTQTGVMKDSESPRLAASSHQWDTQNCNLLVDYILIYSKDSKNPCQRDEKSQIILVRGIVLL